MYNDLFNYLATISLPLAVVVVLIVGSGRWFIQLTALAIIPARRKPAAAQAWLIFIFFLPWLGLLVYLLIGNPKLSKRRRAQQRYVDEMIAGRVREADAITELRPLVAPRIPARVEPIVRLNQKTGGLPPFAGNNAELLPNYQGAVERIVQDIDAAQRYVHVEYYIFADDETGCHVVDALIRAQGRGVKARVLVDHLGNSGFNGRLFKRLAAGGVETHRMLPVAIFDNEWSRADLRNHRKIVVVDGEVGFTGSQNVINNTYNKRSNVKKGLYYEELVARVTGPVVIQLEAVFATDWYSETGVILDDRDFPELAVKFDPTGEMLAQVLPSGSGYATENNLRLFVALLHEARHKIVITTPYFVPDEALLAAITIAAQRGVDVTLIVSGIADQFLVSRAQRSYYEELLEAGVCIRLFDPPVLLHAKHMSIDDDITVIGSSNMDMRSFQLNMEVTLVLYDRDATAKLREVEATYLARSTPVNLPDWQTRPLRQKFVQNTARLVSVLL